MQPHRHLLFALLMASLAGAAQHSFADPLFNGVDLTGWTKRGGAATYHVDNGEIVGASAPPGSPNTFLTTNANFSNFVLELDFKISDTAFNSGVQIRSQSLPTHANGRVFGYQVEIDPAPRAWSGGLYFEGGSPQRPAGWLDDLSDNQAAREAFGLGEWNHFRIVAIDRRIRTWINDVAAADFTDNHATGFLPSGFVGLQVHSVSSGSPGPFEVRWRNINLAEALAETPTATVTRTGPISSPGKGSWVPCCRTCRLRHCSHRQWPRLNRRRSRLRELQAFFGRARLMPRRIPRSVAVRSLRRHNQGTHR